MLPWPPLGLSARAPQVGLSSPAHSRAHLLTLRSDTLSRTRTPGPEGCRALRRAAAECALQVSGGGALAGGEGPEFQVRT